MSEQQMLADLGRLARRDGCIAAGWALEEIERLKRLNATYVADNGKAQDQLRAKIERLRKRVAELETPQWYWDDRDLDSAVEPEFICSYDDVGDIVELRPIHELPKVFALVTHHGVDLYPTREAAEQAESEVSDG
jgi:hypothetical protein